MFPSLHKGGGRKSNLFRDIFNNWAIDDDGINQGSGTGDSKK